MKKSLLLIFVLSVFLIAACGKTTQEAIEGPSVTVEEPPEQVLGEEKTGEARTFTITAKQWEFEPSTIRVNKGDRVKLTIKSIDVAHGFGLSEFGINERLEPGKTTTVEFVADKSGTFRFFCTVLCGSGHSGMDGTLIVT